MNSTRAFIMHRTLELAKDLKYPALEFLPGNSVGAGLAAWELFVNANITSRLEFAIVALEKMSGKGVN